ncbi:phage holin family protein [Sporosarcina limicola]|uniref:Phi LC3 family holin n=1 Tax=Sporosarcina limicola TaxID=34101 RepID=A0A927R6B6_9BACL|nr:phage holin family protein [Sporosarcina limicola]MBE1554819.1 phi LC3 family holin [Sporosarcina limicola]
MKINCKVRMKNPYFVAQIILAIGVPVLAYMGLTAQDITTWGKLFSIIFDAISNPYVLGLVAVSLYNAVLDPTVAGMSDSEQALRYERPRKGVK